MPIRMLSRVFGRASPVQVIGAAGESNATLLQIDVSSILDSHPNAKYSIMAQCAEGEAFPVAVLLTPLDGFIEWIVPSTVLMKTGDLMIEVQAFDGSELIKSFTWRFWVGGSASGGYANPSWMSDLLGAINSIASPVVWCKTKHDRPAFGAINTLYIIGDTAYVWNENPPKYMPLMFDVDEPTKINLINGGEEV